MNVDIHTIHTIDTKPGDRIDKVCDRAAEYVFLHNSAVRFEFNGIIVETSAPIPEELTRDDRRSFLSAALYKQWDEKTEARSKAYWTPERLAEQTERERVAAEESTRRRELCAKAVVVFPFKPVNNESEWTLDQVSARIDYAAWKANNTDSYSARVFTYAEEWASLMDLWISTGGTLASVAEPASRDADYDGISGAMYDMACGILFRHWHRGAELRAWKDASR
jgi:hypothetical protein